LSKGVNGSLQSIQSGDPFDLREAIDWLDLLSQQYSGLFITTHLETFKSFVYILLKGGFNIHETS
jgi:hypothetical protein